MTDDKRNIRRIREALGAAAIVSLVLVGLGAYVRATGSGLQCPDWPLCFNQIVPPRSAKEEFSHRVTAAALVVVSLLLLWRCLRARGGLRRLALIFVGLVLAQAVLGGMAVLTELKPWTVMAHLMVGTVLFQLSAIAAVKLPVGPSSLLPRTRLSAQLAALTALVFTQILMGGFVASTGSSMACPDFPLCGGQLFPVHPTQQLQMLHRLVGFLCVAMAGVVMFSSSARHEPGFQRSAVHVMLLLLVQIVLGAGAVLTNMSLHVAVTHAVVAQAVLFAVLMSYLRSLQLSETRAAEGRALYA